MHIYIHAHTFIEWVGLLRFMALGRISAEIHHGFAVKICSVYLSDLKK